MGRLLRNLAIIAADVSDTTAPTRPRTLLVLCWSRRYSLVIAMGALLQRSTVGIARSLYIAACLASMVMLLTLSMALTHQNADHFRMPEVRRSVERHSFLNESKSDVVDKISAQNLRPTIVFRGEPDPGVERIIEPAPIVQAPIMRLLMRLKLGPSRSSSPDPLS